MPLRIALTGRHDGPELAALLPAIPEALVRARLENAARHAPGLTDHAADPQLADRPQGAVPADRSSARADVRLRHHRLRLHPRRACALADRLRRRPALAARERLPGHLRPQHHRHRRQDHPARARARRGLRGADRPVHPGDARGLRRPRPREARSRAARDRLHPRDRAHDRDAGAARVRVCRNERRRALCGREVREVRPPVRQETRRPARRRPRRRRRGQARSARFRAVEARQARRTRLGFARGAPGARAGTSSARPWRSRCSASTSTSTAAAWT